MLYQASAGLFSIEQNDDQPVEYLLLDDEWAAAVASEMERLADWDRVTISFLTDAADEKTICAVVFTIRQHVSKVPWERATWISICGVIGMAGQRKMMISGFRVGTGSAIVG